MVRIRQSSRWANSKGAQCKDDYSQKDSNDLEPYMYSERQSRVSSVESCGNNGRRDDEEKCNRSYQSMRPNNAAISRQLSEPVAHTCRKRSERDRTALECGALPLYRIVSKLRPTKFGSRNVFLEVSHVPSPTIIVSEL